MKFDINLTFTEYLIVVGLAFILCCLIVIILYIYNKKDKEQKEEIERMKNE